MYSIATFLIFVLLWAGFFRFAVAAVKKDQRFGMVGKTGEVLGFFAFMWVAPGVYTMAAFSGAIGLDSELSFNIWGWILHGSLFVGSILVLGDVIARKFAARGTKASGVCAK